MNDDPPPKTLPIGPCAKCHKNRELGAERLCFECAWDLASKNGMRSEHVAQVHRAWIEQAGTARELQSDAEEKRSEPWEDTE